MSFGQKVLEKYGWKKGDGLGKQNDGIKEAIKPKLKPNNLGLGFKLGAEFQDNWWENVYNRAAANVKVQGDEDGGVGSVGEADGNLEYLPHKKKKSKKCIRNEHSLSQKDGGVGEADDDLEYLPHKKKKSKKSIRDEYSLFQKTNENSLCNEAVEFQDTEEIDIFEKCGGRTVHKGARHGLSLSGKLERLEKHERESLDALIGSNLKKKRKKRQ